MRFWPRKRQPQSGWEQHPCPLPDYEELALCFGVSPQVLINNVWHCHCGRRWWLRTFDESNQQRPHPRPVYQELLPEFDGDEIEDGLKDLEDLANGGATQ
jgi:hypothetical protein